MWSSLVIESWILLMIAIHLSVDSQGTEQCVWEKEGKGEGSGIFKQICVSIWYRSLYQIRLSKKMNFWSRLWCHIVCREMYQISPRPLSLDMGYYREQRRTEWSNIASHNTKRNERRYFISNWIILLLYFEMEFGMEWNGIRIYLFLKFLHIYFILFYSTNTHMGETGKLSSISKVKLETFKRINNNII